MEVDSEDSATFENGSGQSHDRHHDYPPVKQRTSGGRRLYLQQQSGWPVDAADGMDLDGAEEHGMTARQLLPGSQDHPPGAHPPSEGSRKMCNCRKARCLKLYCVCFSAGMYCSGCSCIDCRNVPGNKDGVLLERERILARSPTAFGSKVAEAAEGQLAYRKGCKCRKSRCLKKYCECFNASVHCSQFCRCDDCLNKPSAPEAPPPPAPEAPVARQPVFSDYNPAAVHSGPGPQHAQAWQQQHYYAGGASAAATQLPAASQYPWPSNATAHELLQHLEGGSLAMPVPAPTVSDQAALPHRHAGHAGLRGPPTILLQHAQHAWQQGPASGNRQLPASSAPCPPPRLEVPRPSGSQPVDPANPKGSGGLAAASVLLSAANQLLRAGNPDPSRQGGGEQSRGASPSDHLTCKEEPGVGPQPTAPGEAVEGTGPLPTGSGMLPPPTPAPRSEPQVMADPDSLTSEIRTIPACSQGGPADPSAAAGDHQQSMIVGSGELDAHVAASRQLQDIVAGTCGAVPLPGRSPEAVRGAKAGAGSSKGQDNEVMWRLLLSPNFARHVAVRAGLDGEAVQSAAHLLRLLAHEAGKGPDAAAPPAPSPPTQAAADTLPPTSATSTQPQHPAPLQDAPAASPGAAAPAGYPSTLPQGVCTDPPLHPAGVECDVRMVDQDHTDPSAPKFLCKSEGQEAAEGAARATGDHPMGDAPDGSSQRMPCGPSHAPSRTSPGSSSRHPDPRAGGDAAGALPSEHPTSSSASPDAVVANGDSMTPRGDTPVLGLSPHPNPHGLHLVSPLPASGNILVAPSPDWPAPQAGAGVDPSMSPSLLGFFAEGTPGLAAGQQGQGHRGAALGATHHMLSALLPRRGSDDSCDAPPLGPAASHPRLHPHASGPLGSLDPSGCSRQSQDSSGPMEASSTALSQAAAAVAAAAVLQPLRAAAGGPRRQGAPLPPLNIPEGSHMSTHKLFRTSAQRDAGAASGGGGQPQYLPAAARMHVPTAGPQNPAPAAAATGGDSSWQPGASTRLQGRVVTGSNRLHVPQQLRGAAAAAAAAETALQPTSGGASGGSRGKAASETARVLGSKLQGPTKLTIGSFRLEPPPQKSAPLRHDRPQHIREPSAAMVPPRRQNPNHGSGDGGEREGPRSGEAAAGGKWKDVHGSQGQADSAPGGSAPMSPGAGEQGPSRKGPRCRGGDGEADLGFQQWGGKRRRTSVSSPSRRTASCEAHASKAADLPLRRVASADPSWNGPGEGAPRVSGRPPRSEPLARSGTEVARQKLGMGRGQLAEARAVAARSRKVTQQQHMLLEGAETECEEEVVQALFDLRQSA